MGFFQKGGEKMYFDIHSHILPGIDDGARDICESAELINSMKKEGITEVIATPHFYPNEMNFGDFLQDRNEAYETLCSDLKGDIPKIYLGCEILYFRRMGASRELEKLGLNNSKYILLELCDGHIDKYLFEDFCLFAENGIIPIIAHIERYHKNKNFKKLLEEVKAKNYPVQINSSSLLNKKYRRAIKRVFKSGLFCVIATDTHSLQKRPPVIKSAFEVLKKDFGEEIYSKIISNNRILYNEIIGDSVDK